MEFFKIFLVKGPKIDRISSDLSKYCSKIPKIIPFDNKAYLAVKYNPEEYCSNVENINEFFKKGEATPLMVTNFKFLRLLNQSQNAGLRINRFKLDDGEDEEFQELILEHSNDLNLLKEFLDSTYQKINYFEFKYKDNRNFIGVYESGVISITEGFEDTQEKKVLLEKIVGLLIEGKGI